MELPALAVSAAKEKSPAISNRVLVLRPAKESGQFGQESALIVEYRRKQKNVIQSINQSTQSYDTLSTNQSINRSIWTTSKLSSLIKKIKTAKKTTEFHTSVIWTVFPGRHPLTKKHDTRLEQKENNWRTVEMLVNGRHSKASPPPIEIVPFPSDATTSDSAGPPTLTLIT